MLSYRLKPFGLWQKVFNVKPKVVGSEHAECGGAMVSKMPTSYGQRELLVSKPADLG